ncbi:ependymin-like [Xyrichtys novacula]|uniref:Ependymin-like n=1 Tax=Xyrichtys novacula TaxID=13765 RepID=A0AAV1HM91_XYRNO|nr:ependymin-like [Xyrichtys novacula]
MRTFVLLVCLSAACLAQRPKPCTSPPLLTGGLSVSTQSEKLQAYAKYSYDALGKRIRLSQFGTYDNKTFHLDVLLLYKQGVMYKINTRNQTCCKKQLTMDFHPLEIPEDATLLGEVVLGSSSGWGQGVLVNTWTGEMQLKRGQAKYMNTVTEFGCVPVSSLFRTDKTGWILTSFYNNVIGLADPAQFIPPPFCKGVPLEKEDEEEPVSFYSMFMKQKYCSL